MSGEPREKTVDGVLCHWLPATDRDPQGRWEPYTPVALTTKIHNRAVEASVWENRHEAAEQRVEQLQLELKVLPRQIAVLQEKHAKAQTQIVGLEEELEHQSAEAARTITLERELQKAREELALHKANALDEGPEPSVPVEDSAVKVPTPQDPEYDTMVIHELLHYTPASTRKGRGHGRLWRPYNAEQLTELVMAGRNERDELLAANSDLRAALDEAKKVRDEALDQLSACEAAFPAEEPAPEMPNNDWVFQIELLRPTHNLPSRLQLVSPELARGHFTMMHSYLQALEDNLLGGEDEATFSVAVPEPSCIWEPIPDAGTAPAWKRGCNGQPSRLLHTSGPGRPRCDHCDGIVELA